MTSEELAADWEWAARFVEVGILERALRSELSDAHKAHLMRITAALLNRAQQIRSSSKARREGAK